MTSYISVEVASRFRGPEIQTGPLLRGRGPHSGIIAKARSLTADEVTCSLHRFDRSKRVLNIELLRFHHSSSLGSGSPIGRIALDGGFRASWEKTLVDWDRRGEFLGAR
jgi:hypothetical protein